MLAPELVDPVKKIRLIDRVKVTELIGKLVDVAAFRENVHHDGLTTLVLRDYTGVDETSRFRGRATEPESAAGERPGLGPAGKPGGSIPDHGMPVEEDELDPIPKEVARPGPADIPVVTFTIERPPEPRQIEADVD